MGGLATRAYIRSNGYEDDIQNLITLGTPHLGTPLANYLAWSAVFPFIENFATAQQIPNSLFLRGLNYKYDTKNVKHFSFAGTKLSEKTWVKLFVCLMEPNFCAKGGNQVISDTIVPKSSSNFSGGSCIQTSDTHSNTFGPAYYNSETMALIKDVLLHPEQSPSCPMPLALPPANTVEAIVATSTIAPSQEQIAVANYDGGKGFQAFLESNSAQLSMNLVTPTGSILNASSCASFPGVICTKDSSTTTTVESISVPESLATGNWQAKVSATSLVMPTTYNQHIFISRPVRVRAMTDSASYAPNAPIQLLATVTDESLALIPGVSVATKVTDPAGFLSVVPLFDDGTHGDSVPADGTFSNLYSATGAEGLYLYETTASGIARGSTFTITSKGSAFVETVPDLMVISPKLTLHVPSGSTIATISASFKNIGDRAASNVTIDFYAKDLVKGDKVLIGQTHVGSIAPNQTVNATFNWNISVGRAEVSAAPSDTNLFEDRDYSNEQATAELDSCRWIKGLTPPNKNTICAGSEIAAHEPGVKEMKPVP
jgi:hypothetical protein